MPAGAVDFDVRDSYFRGQVTQAAATLINVLVPPKAGLRSRIMTLVYTSGATAHTLTILRAIGSTTLVSNAAASQSVLTLAAQPATSNGGPTNDVAANDYLVWENDDGTWAFDLVASVSGLNITMTNALAKAASAGKRVWFLGITTDLNTDGFAHPQLKPTASATTTYENNVIGIAGTLRPNEPMLVQSNNITAQGFVERLAVAYSAR